MNFGKRATSHVADAPPKRGEIGEAMRKISEAHKRLMPVRRCHPWRSKQFATKPKQNDTK
jgi:hypothetical protein